MKKWIAFTIVLVYSFSLLAGCSGGDSSSANNSNSNGGSGSTSSGNDNSASTPSTSDSGGSGNSAPANTPTPAYIPVERTVEVPDKPLDLSDDSIYFVVIDGVKFDLMDIRVKDFLDAGFFLDEDEDDEDYFDENTLVEANSTIGSTLIGTYLYKGDTYNYIFIVPVNLSDQKVPVKDCEIQQLMFNIRDSSAFDIYTVCNLSLGCTEEEVIGVFGDDYGELSDVVLTYSDDTGAFLDRYFSFYKNADGIIYEIQIFTNKRIIEDWEKNMFPR
ncbi:MAG: hypothetical protein FWH28_03415 [Clostridiales bacterium]|nr:hypothetical protein [Clostridiales bacterium]